MKYLLLSVLVFNLSAKVELISWSSPEGIKRFSESQHKSDFFKLVNFFQGQPDGIVCGPTTGAIVLNALRLRKDKGLPKTSFDSKFKTHLPKTFDPSFERYTPKNFVSGNVLKVKTWEQIYGEPIKGKKDYGLQLRQLHKMFLAHQTSSKITIVNDQTSLNSMSKQFKSNLEDPNDFIIINYARKSLGQKGGGHISPIGAYHQNSKSFLILDVNPNKDNWVWVREEDLYNSMKTFDTVENRGYLIIKEK